MLKNLVILKWSENKKIFIRPVYGIMFMEIKVLYLGLFLIFIPKLSDLKQFILS